MTLPLIYDYSLIRGDTTKLNKFKITDSEGTELTLADTDEIYFTMKKQNKETVVLQKKLSDGGITYEDDGYYHITLETDDTNELYATSTYVYDIELKTSDFVKTILSGTITLVKDVTTKEDY